MSTPSPPLRVLLVDDSPDDRLLVSRELRKVVPDVRIDEAGGPEDFLQQLADPGWDVAVTDYELGWTTGLELFRRLREVRADLPVIMFTASGSEEVAVQGLKEGLDDYITKTPRHYGRIPYAVLACAERLRQKRQIQSANDALRASEALYRALSEATPDLVWVSDARGRVEYVNRHWEDYTGIGTEELNGRGWQSLVHPDEVDAIQRAWTHANQHALPIEMEYRLLRREGSWCWFLGRTVPLKDDAGVVVRWVGIGTDIHQRKLMEQELRAKAAALQEADRQKNQFLATLAHELRNPMAPIRYAAALIRPGVRPEVLGKLKDTIERQSAHMSRLLDDLLDMSRITRDVIELQRAPVDLAAVVQEVVGHSQPEAQAQGHQLTFRAPGASVWVDGDLARLQQVAGNLLSNAIKYTPPGGRIDVRVTAEDGQGVLRVRDTGVGLSPEMLPQLFQLFSQLHRGLTVSSGGLGIGLAVSRRLMELHGGTLEAASAGLSQGAEFTARLPLMAGEPSAAAPGRAAGSTAKKSGPLQVLVVDDNVDAAHTLADLLGLEGHRVDVATTGREALAMARKARPDVVVLDIGLPDISGVEVARQLRADVATADTLIVAVTGWGQEEDRRRTEAVGVDHHLVKPVDPVLLIQTMALGRREG